MTLSHKTNVWIPCAQLWLKIFESQRGPTYSNSLYPNKLAIRSQLSMSMRTGISIWLFMKVPAIVKKHLPVSPRADMQRQTVVDYSQVERSTWSMRWEQSRWIVSLASRLGPLNSKLLNFIYVFCLGSPSFPHPSHPNLSHKTQLINRRLGLPCECYPPAPVIVTNSVRWSVCIWTIYRSTNEWSIFFIVSLPFLPDVTKHWRFLLFVCFDISSKLPEVLIVDSCNTSSIL